MAAVSLSDLLEQVGVPQQRLDGRVSDVHLRQISLFLTSWTMVARFLELDDADVEEIDVDGRDEKERRLKMLRRWKDKNAFKATYRELVEALLSLEMTGHAEKVCRLLRPAGVTITDGDSILRKRSRQQKTTASDHYLMTQAKAAINEKDSEQEFGDKAGSSGSMAASKLVIITVVVILVVLKVVSTWLCIPIFPVSTISTWMYVHSPIYPIEPTSTLRAVYEKSSTLGPDFDSTIPYIKPIFFQIPSQNQVTLQEVLTVDDGDRILIVGEPGTGKTRLTHVIIQKWKDKEILTHCNLFAYHLRQFIKHDSSSPLEQDYRYKKAKEKIERCHGWCVCFLLDGLDEYRSGYTDSRNFFYLLMHGLELPRATVIVTSRNISDLQLVNWARQYRISLFSDKQRSDFFLEAFKLNKTRKNLEGVLSRYPNLWQMCHKPLHASLLINAFSDDFIDLTDIPTETRLFEQITIRTYERELQKASETGWYGNKIQDLKHLLNKFPIVSTLCSLAFNGFIYNKLLFNDSEVPNILQSTNLSYLVVEPQYHDPTDDKVYTFSHLTLMHFLAAVHLTIGRGSEGIDLILEHKDKFGVNEVLNFFCGLTNSFLTQFRKLLLQSTMWGKPLYLYRCIYEAQSHSEPTQIKSAAHDLIVTQNGRIDNIQATLKIPLTVYDMQAIGFVFSSAPNDWISLKFDFTFFNEDNWFSSFLFSLTRSQAVFSNFEYLSICEDNIHFNDNTTKYLNDFFARTPKLSSLQLHSWNMSSLQLVEVFKAAHTFCPTLTVIGLSNILLLHVLNTTEVLEFKIMCPELHHYHQKHGLYLYMYSDIDDELAVALTDYIRSTALSSTPCRISIVDLNCNHISSSHLIDILKALYIFCPNLTMVNLSGKNKVYMHHQHQSESLVIYLDNNMYNVDSDEAFSLIQSVVKSSRYWRYKKLYTLFNDKCYEGSVLVT